MEKTDNSLKHVRAIKARYEDLLLAWPGVMSVGVGVRQQDDASTGEMCIVVTVRNKRAIDNLLPGDALPDQIEGVMVDVQESGDIVPWETGSPLLPVRPTYSPPFNIERMD